jgi:molecular chaperone GrpE
MSDEQNKKEEQVEQTIEQKAEEYLNNWKRERADFLNYKKDEAKRVEEFVKYANEDIILEVMELIDDIEIAAREVPGIGLEHVLKKFSDLFKKYNVERIDVEGKKFDPELHEAVEIEKEGERLKEIRAGYKMRDKVVRPARVKIVK